METYKNIKSYINSLSGEAKKQSVKMYKAIKKLLPKAEEAIRYGMPTFRLNGKNLLHFAAMKNHIGFYPTPSGVKAFEKEIAKRYTYSKGAIQFPIKEKLPLALVSKITKFRHKTINK